MFFDGRRASSSALGDYWLTRMNESGRRVHGPTAWIRAVPFEQHTSCTHRIAWCPDRSRIVCRQRYSGRCLYRCLLAACIRNAKQCLGSSSLRVIAAASRRGVFRQSLSRRHNAQAVFPQSKFQQRFERARAINPRFRTEMHRENWPLIDPRIIGQAQPINRDAAFSGTVDGIATHRLEQPVTATTTALKRWLRRCSPHGHKRRGMRAAHSHNCLHLSKAVTILF
jgi:hypothetical protein